MKNGIFTLDLKSVADAAIMAVVVAVVAMLVQLVGTGHFDVFTADWISIGKNAVNLSFATVVITIGRDLISTNSGSILGIGPTNGPELG